MREEKLSPSQTAGASVRWWRSLRFRLVVLVFLAMAPALALLVFAAAGRSLKYNVLSFLGAAAFALIAAWVGGSAVIARRVDALVGAARRMAAGDLAARTGLRYGRGELDEVARAFDEMAETVTRRQGEIAKSAEDLRASNATVWALIEASPLPIVAFDRAGLIAIWNRAAERVFEWSEAEVLGRPSPLVPPELDSEFREHFRRVWDGEVLANIETCRRTRSGRIVDVSIASAAIRDASGAVALGIALYTDITEKKRAERQLAQQRDALFRSEKLADLGRLAAGVAHELKNPLTVIDARVQLLKHQVTEGAITADQIAHYVSGLEGAAERMKRIMHGLSTYAKPPKPEPTLLAVGELFAAIEELVAYPAQSNQVELVTEVPASLPPIRGDRSQCLQILVNLALNAVEAMSQAGGTLTLRARMSPATADSEAAPAGAAAVLIEVADTGPGIPMEALEKIWEPFYTTKAEGTGLGLSIVRALIEEQSGAIAVETKLGVGTVFRITLPAAALAGDSDVTAHGYARSLSSTSDRASIS